MNWSNQLITLQHTATHELIKSIDRWMHQHMSSIDQFMTRVGAFINGSCRCRLMKCVREDSSWCFHQWQLQVPFHQWHLQLPFMNAPRTVFTNIFHQMAPTTAIDECTTNCLHEHISSNGTYNRHCWMHQHVKCQVLGDHLESIDSCYKQNQQIPACSKTLLLQKSPIKEAMFCKRDL